MQFRRIVRRKREDRKEKERLQGEFAKKFLSRRSWLIVPRMRCQLRGESFHLSPKEKQEKAENLYCQERS